MKRILTAALACLSALSPVRAAAEQLAVTLYTQADGLAGDGVRSLWQDARGYLWIGTTTGLSRFDGERFATYGTADGLPHRWINAVREDSRGRIWVATSGGLALLEGMRGASGRLFRTFTFGEEVRANVVQALAEDGSGRIWVTAGETLWRLDETSGAMTFERVPLAVPQVGLRQEEYRALACTSDGSVWVTTRSGVVRLLPDGGTARCALAPPPGWMLATALLADRDGRVWVAGDGVVAFMPEAPGREVAAACQGAIPTALGESASGPRASGEPMRLAGLPRSGYGNLTQARDGSVWIPTTQGLYVVNGGTVTRLGEADGLVGNSFLAVLGDREGGIWIGSAARGLMRLDRSGFSRYTVADGLASEEISAVISDLRGGVLPIGTPASSLVHILRDGRFDAVRIPVPAWVKSPGWGWNQATLLDSRGDWWVPTGSGAFRFSPGDRVEDLAGSHPVARYHGGNGLGGDLVFRVFEDSRGDIWFGMLSEMPVVHWRRTEDRCEGLGAAQGLPRAAGSAFAEDSSGAVWVGFYAGGLARIREHRLDVLGAADGAPASFVTALFADSRGRLWVGSAGAGVVRIDNPTAENPCLAPVTTMGGQALEGVYCFTEDAWGRIYMGTLRGIDRLDPETGHVWHFDAATGLVNNAVVSALRDATGDLWFATHGGVARLRPRMEREAPAPRVAITEVRAPGLELALPELGANVLPPFALAAGVHEMAVSFTAVSLAPGARLRYQYSLGGGNGEEWSTPTAERRANLLGLGPGRYALRVRAVRSDGATSEPVEIAFSIAAPLWRRWWFVAGVMLAAVGGVAAAFRARVRRLRAEHAVRERIARDLHDELGLSLARIAMLSEVSRRRGGAGGEGDGELAEIGASAVELMDATSDMAWALDPSRDTLENLLARLRRLASDVFESTGVSWNFVAPEDGLSMSIPAEARRHVYLVLKEALHNVARHAGATAVEVSVVPDDGWLVASVRDDGRGFNADAHRGASAPDHGRGLAGMRRRAEELGGELTIRSAPGSGTTVVIRVRTRA